MKNFKVLALVLLCLLALAPAAEATWPGANGSILFARSFGTGPYAKSDIWIAKPSGEQRRLTRTPRINEIAAAFSPDGRTIAYVARFKEDADIWLMRSDGSDKRPLVRSDLDEFQPAFFPSGRSLAYSVYDGERGWTVHTIRLDGSGQRRLVDRATFPVVSPDGRLLAYSANNDGVGGIRLLNLRSGNVRRLTTGSAQGLDFSPDGRRILFAGQRDCRPGGPLRFQLLVIGLHQRHSRYLRRGCNEEDAGAIWSPNGRKILYTHKTQRGRVLEFRLRMMTSGGAPSLGAPRHWRGAQEFGLAWQPR